ncbi:MAG TPA: O-antigen ligase family protein [Solirubrobacteraceae bacterium]
MPRSQLRFEIAGWVGLFGLAPAALIYLSFNAGGYFPSAPGLLSVAFACALALRTALAERPFEGLDRALAIPLVGLTLYAAFQLTSTLWSQASANTLDSFTLTSLYVLAFAFFGSVRFSRGCANWLLRAVFGALTIVCLIGLTSRLLPHIWPTAGNFFADRLDYPLTYWNAEGMVAAIALILGLHLSADRHGHWSVNSIAAAVLPALAATLLLTFSRGAIGVGLLGLLTYCLLTRLSTLPAPLLALAAPVALALHSAWEATALSSSRPTGALAISQGRHVAMTVLACMLGAGLLRAVLLLLDGHIARLGIVRRPPRQALRVGLGASAGLIVLVLALAAGAGGFAGREYDKFVNGNKETVAQTRERLTDPANHGRLPLWRAAVDIYDTQQLHGSGAGTFQQYYPRYRMQAGYVVDAHSLYLQSLAELGIVGFVLILIVVLGMLVGLAARTRGPDRALYAALFAVCLAWVVHQGFDWDWQMPAATLGVFMLAGLGLARPRDGKVGLGGLPFSRSIVVFGWLALAVGPLLAGASYARLQHSSTELARGECSAAKREALSALSLSARRPQAYAIVGVCDLQLGFATAAVPATSQAVELEPQNWEEWYWLGVARAAAGLDPHQAIGKAIALDPLEPGLRNAEHKLNSDNPRIWELAAPRLRAEALTSGKFEITHL